MCELGARTRGADFIILNEVNKRPGDESTFFPLKTAGQFITNTPASGDGPGFGTFIGTPQWNPGSDFATTDPEFEIGVMSRSFYGGVRVTVIGMYRSPNMKNYSDIERFYNKVETYLGVALGRLDDIVFIAGDDNSPTTTSSAYAKTANQHLEAIRRKFNGEHVINRGTRKGPTGSWHQPDHILAFYNPMRFKIDAPRPLKGVGDHLEMHVNADLGFLKVPKMQWYRQNFVVSEGKTKEIEADLKLTFETFRVEAIECKDHWCQEDLDYLVGLFQNKVNFVRMKNRVMQTRMLPVNRHQVKTPEERAVQYELNKISEYNIELSRNPGSIDLKRKLKKHEDLYHKKVLFAGKKYFLMRSTIGEITIR